MAQGEKTGITHREEEIVDGRESQMPRCEGKDNSVLERMKNGKHKSNKMPQRK